MSDWTDEMEDYIDNNWDDLVHDFTEKYSKEWYEFVGNKFHDQLGEMLQDKADHYNDIRNDR